METTLVYHLDNVIVRFGTNFTNKLLVFLMGINCATHVADIFILILFFKRDCLLSLSDEYQAAIIEAFNSTSGSINDLFKIDIIILNK